MQIMVRAGDESGEVQPYVQPWNPSGYLWNVVHSVGVEVVKEVKPAETPAEAAPLQHPAVFKNSCIGCHGDEVIRPQRLTRGQWEREVDKMVRWGAQVKPQDKQALLDYLAKEFPYRMKK